MDDILEVKDIYVKIGNVRILKNVSALIERGEFISILGRNGAGKSTLLRVIVQNQVPTMGKVIFNFNENTKGRIGVVYQESVLDKDLTVKENLTLRAGMYGYEKKNIKKRVKNVVEKIDCKELLNKKYGELSGGQRRKVDIARALISNPEILVLDEPTSGLDVESRQHIWEIINGLNRNEKLTVLLTTHYLEEAGNSDQIILLDNGRLTDNISSNDFKEKYKSNSMEEAFLNAWSEGEKKI